MSLSHQQASLGLFTWQGPKRIAEAGITFETVTTLLLPYSIGQSKSFEGWRNRFHLLRGGVAKSHRKGQPLLQSICPMVPGGSTPKMAAVKDRFHILQIARIDLVCSH